MTGAAALAANASRQAGRASPWIAVAIGFSIPLSTALDNLLLAALLLSWIAAGGFREKLAAIRGNRLALVAGGVFALHLAASLYSEGSAGDVLYALNKGATYLLIPVLVSLGSAPWIRERMLDGFMLAVAVTLVLSYALWLGLLPEGPQVKGVASDPVIFKLHITHGVLVAFGAFLFALRASAAVQMRARALWASASALAAFNVLFMVHGRTGQLVLVALALYAAVSWLRWRSLLLAGAAGAIVAAIAYVSPSSSVHYRMKNTIAELQDWQAGKPAQPSNMRPETWRNSFRIVIANPVLGVGTGGFAAAYDKQVAGASKAGVVHPENQYLYYAVQFGLVGLAAIIAAFAVQWRLASRLATPGDAHVARGLLITMAVGCLFNSFLLDHTESLLYAGLSGALYAGLRPPGATREA